MSLYGITRGTEVEKEVDQYAEAECRGVGMYCAIALLARERGLNDLAEDLMKIAADEASHAALYMVLNGRVPEDIYEGMKKSAQVETVALARIKEFAQRVREMGMDEAAEELETAAEDEGRHGEILNELVKRNVQS